MKSEAIKYWRMRNHGYPHDTLEGQGDVKALARDMIQFWQRVTMGSKLSIEVFRSLETRDGSNSTDMTADSIADEIFAGLDLNDSNEEQS